MWERDGFGRALSVENIATIPAVVFPIRKTECGPAAHTYVGVDPLWGLASGQRLSRCDAGHKTYSAAVEHTT